MTLTVWTFNNRNNTNTHNNNRQVEIKVKSSSDGLRLADIWSFLSSFTPFVTIFTSHHSLTYSLTSKWKKKKTRWPAKASHQHHDTSTLHPLIVASKPLQFKLNWNSLNQDVNFCYDLKNFSLSCQLSASAIKTQTLCKIPSDDTLAFKHLLLNLLLLAIDPTDLTTTMVEPKQRQRS